MGKSIMAQSKSLSFVIIALRSRKVKTEDKKLYINKKSTNYSDTLASHF